MADPTLVPSYAFGRIIGVMAQQLTGREERARAGNYKSNILGRVGRARRTLHLTDGRHRLTTLKPPQEDCLKMDYGPPIRLKRSPFVSAPSVTKLKRGGIGKQGNNGSGAEAHSHFSARRPRPEEWQASSVASARQARLGP